MVELLRNTMQSAIVASLLLIGGCAKTTTTNTSEVNGTGSSVQVLYSEPTDRKYTELGLVTTQTGQTIFHDRSAEGMITKLKIEAENLLGGAEKEDKKSNIHILEKHLRDLEETANSSSGIDIETGEDLAHNAGRLH